jgi:hypothetical protein
MAPADLAQAVDADVRARRAKKAKKAQRTSSKETTKTAPAASTRAVASSLSVAELQRYGMSLLEAQRLAMMQASSNLDKQTTDLLGEPTLRQDTVVFRATVEKYTSKVWPLRCQEVAAVAGAGVQFK